MTPNKKAGRARALPGAGQRTPARRTSQSTKSRARRALGGKGAIGRSTGTGDAGGGLYKLYRTDPLFMAGGPAGSAGEDNKDYSSHRFFTLPEKSGRLSAIGAAHIGQKRPGVQGGGLASRQAAKDAKAYSPLTCPFAIFAPSREPDCPRRSGQGDMRTGSASGAAGGGCDSCSSTSLGQMKSYISRKEVWPHAKPQRREGRCEGRGRFAPSRLCVKPIACCHPPGYVPVTEGFGALRVSLHSVDD